jgi:tetratricopeptide (TPR) repeat protein
MSFHEGLRDGADQCYSRGLVLASKWASLQLSGITDDQSDDEQASEDGSSSGQGQEMYSRRERDHILLAQSMINTGEYLRCAHFLRKQSSLQGKREASRSKAGSGMLNIVSSLKVTSKKGIFLAVYALYMAGEKLKEQQLLEIRGQESKSAEKLAQEGGGGANGAKGADGSMPKARPGNPFLGDLFNDLYPMYTAGALDGFLMYLFAIVVRDLKKQSGGPMALRLLLSSSPADGSSGSGSGLPSALQLLVESAAMYPWNWSCWVDMAALCQHQELPVPQWSAFYRPDDSTTSNSSTGDAGRGGGGLSDQWQAVWIMYQHFLAQYYTSLNDGAGASEVVSNLAACKVYRMRGGGEDNGGMDGSSSTSGSSSRSMYSGVENGEVTEVHPALLTYYALAQYSNRDYSRAQEAFEEARALDPHKLEHVDTYSNILYVKEKKAELSHLARAVTKVDKFAAETCVVTGNYYSLRGQHEKAVLSFQRALRINKNFLFLWTLMGHEFVELRNTQSAVQCYRRAVEVSQSDYKAWYGLGQMYELLHLYQYALYYFKRATSIRPHDARMCSAVGSCMVKLGSKRDAMLVFERAVACGDWEGVATRELARLYREEGRVEEAATCYMRKLASAGHPLEELLEGTSAAGGASASVGDISSGGMLPPSTSSTPVQIDQEQVEGVLFLANFYYEKRDFRAAEVFCNFLVDFVGPEADEARAMLRDMRSQMLLSQASINAAAAVASSGGSGRKTRSQSRALGQI